MPECTLRTLSVSVWPDVLVAVMFGMVQFCLSMYSMHLSQDASEIVD